MELTAQPWAAVELRGPSSLAHALLEDAFSVAEDQPTVQLKKSMEGMKQESGTKVMNAIESWNHRISESSKTG
jgi:hypothetical protein